MNFTIFCLPRYQICNLKNASFGVCVCVHVRASVCVSVYMRMPVCQCVSMKGKCCLGKVSLKSKNKEVYKVVLIFKNIFRV